MRFKEYIIEKKLIWKIVLVVGLCLIDLLTKAFFAGYFYSGGESIEIIDGVIELTYVENTGAAFGSFGDFTIILTIISGVFIVGFVLFDILYKKRYGKVYITAYTFVIAGALGNFVDRIFFGYVRDFIRLPMFNFVCNIADILICVGVVLYAVDILFSHGDKENKADGE